MICKTCGDPSQSLFLRGGMHITAILRYSQGYRPVAVLWSRRMPWIPRDSGLCIAACFGETRCGWRCYFIKGLRWRCFHVEILKCRWYRLRLTREIQRNTEKDWKTKKEHMEHIEDATLICIHTAWDLWASGQWKVNLRSRPEEGKPSITPLGLAACCVQDEDSMEVASICCTCCTCCTMVTVHLHVVNCRQLSLIVVVCFYYMSFPVVTCFAVGCCCMLRSDQGANCQEKALLISTKLLEFGAAATVEFHSDGKNFSV